MAVDSSETLGSGGTEGKRGARDTLGGGTGPAEKGSAKSDAMLVKELSADAAGRIAGPDNVVIVERLEDWCGSMGECGNV